MEQDKHMALLNQALDIPDKCHQVNTLLKDTHLKVIPLKDILPKDSLLAEFQDMDNHNHTQAASNNPDFHHKAFHLANIHLKEVFLPQDINTHQDSIHLKVTLHITEKCDLQIYINFQISYLSTTLTYYFK